MSVKRITRSPWTPVLLAVAALIASLSRWYVQGSHNLYTALVKRFYVPDPDLGWRVSTQHPIWLGLDACALITVLALVTAGVVLVIHRREHARGTLMTSLGVASSTPSWCSSPRRAKAAEGRDRALSRDHARAERRELRA